MGHTSHYSKFLRTHTQSVWEDSEEETTDANVREYTKRSIEIQYLEHPGKAKALKESARTFETVEMQTLWHAKCREKVWQILYTVTTGDALETVQDYGVEGVHELNASFKISYGSAENKDIESLIRQYESGVVRADGKKMKVTDDPVKYFIGMKKLSRLRQG